jgi:hypothetical protein
MMAAVACRGAFENAVLFTLMVRRRYFSAVSNHEARGPSFETRFALLRMKSSCEAQP